MSPSPIASGLSAGVRGPTFLEVSEVNNFTWPGGNGSLDAPGPVNYTLAAGLCTNFLFGYICYNI